MTSWSIWLFLSISIILFTVNVSADEANGFLKDQEALSRVKRSGKWQRTEPDSSYYQHYTSNGNRKGNNNGRYETDRFRQNYFPTRDTEKRYGSSARYYQRSGGVPRNGEEGSAQVQSAAKCDSRYDRNCRAPPSQRPATTLVKKASASNGCDPRDPRCRPYVNQQVRAQKPQKPYEVRQLGCDPYSDSDCSETWKGVQTPPSQTSGTKGFSDSYDARRQSSVKGQVTPLSYRYVKNGRTDEAYDLSENGRQISRASHGSRQKSKAYEIQEGSDNEEEGGPEADESAQRGVNGEHPERSDAEEDSAEDGARDNANAKNQERHESTENGEEAETEELEAEEKARPKPQASSENGEAEESETEDQSAPEWHGSMEEDGKRSRESSKKGHFRTGQHYRSISEKKSDNGHYNRGTLNPYESRTKGYSGHTQRYRSSPTVTRYNTATNGPLGNRYHNREYSTKGLSGNGYGSRGTVLANPYGSDTKGVSRNGYRQASYRQPYSFKG
ncbi:HIRA-interacting protein 3-like isoform X2 [Protopterus annectens]|nr:HIRA-interacting protein 3-like isoform X2 [Protopterus annectens]